MKNEEFIKLTERNDWEGETWNFYIPIKDNETAIKKLSELIKKYPSYTLSLLPINENEIDNLIKNDDHTSYMATHNKLSGRLDFKDYPNKSTNGIDDPFYKGDIEKYLIIS